jgi:uncharacterized cupredoxin-like copper-binding protein
MLIAAGLSVLVAAAGSSAAARELRPASSQSSTRATLVTRVRVTASEFKFVLSKKRAKRGTVVFKETNAGKVSHDFSIKGKKTRLLKHGQSSSLRVTFLRKGRYAYRCTVPGHAKLGMKGVFTIT